MRGHAPPITVPRDMRRGCVARHVLGSRVVSEDSDQSSRRRAVAGAGYASIGSASDLAQLEARATAALDPDVADYVNRGSGRDITRAANQAAWSRLRLRPHIGRDVSAIDTGVRVLGTNLAAPVLVAPTAMQRLVHEGGERATARAAARAGAVMIVSMVANYSLEEIAAAAPDAPRWAQMYFLRDRDRTRALAERARDAGYTAIVATVDGAAVPYGEHGGATPSRGSLAIYLGADRDVKTGTKSFVQVSRSRSSSRSRIRRSWAHSMRRK